MCRRSDTNENDCDPQIRSRRREHYRHDGECADQHRGLAALVYRPAALDQRTGNIAAADAADVGDDVDDREWDPEIFEIEAMLLVEKIRKPEQVDPPDRIGKKFSDGEGPRLPVREQASPRNSRGRFRRVALDIPEFDLRQTLVFLGPFVYHQPESQP